MADKTSILYDEGRLRAWVRQHDRARISPVEADMLDLLELFVALGGDQELGYDYEQDVAVALAWAADLPDTRCVVRVARRRA